MMLKFNGGRGALLCSTCRVIVMEDLHDYEFHALEIMLNAGCTWKCAKCSPAAQRKQNEKFIETVNSIAEEYSLKRRIHVRNKLAGGVIVNDN
jgi:radical SAM superfamily enzyme YgiQ (UPF0313 family)